MTFDENTSKAIDSARGDAGCARASSWRPESAMLFHHFTHRALSTHTTLLILREPAARDAAAVLAARDAVRHARSSSSTRTTAIRGSGGWKDSEARPEPA